MHANLAHMLQAAGNLTGNRAQTTCRVAGTCMCHFLNKARKSLSSDSITFREAALRATLARTMLTELQRTAQHQPPEHARPYTVFKGFYMPTTEVQAMQRAFRAALRIMRAQCAALQLHAAQGFEQARTGLEQPAELTWDQAPEADTNLTQVDDIHLPLE